MNDNSTRQNHHFESRSIQETIRILEKQRSLIIGSTITLGVSALLFSLLSPPKFTSTATLMPPQQAAGMHSILGQLGGLSPTIASNITSLKNPSDLYIGMLKSRSIADRLIQQHKLKKRYKTTTMETARKKLQHASKITSGRDGIISISVEDTDPRFAAKLATTYVEQLMKLHQRLAVTEASTKRIFLENQLKQTATNLLTAEMALRQTQERTGMIQPDTQLSAIINTVTHLKASIAAKEVQLKALRTYATEQNPLYQRTSEELSGLRIELAKMENGKEVTGDVMLPIDKLPQSGLEYLRRQRDVRLQSSIFELLSKQEEMARIEEAQESSQIQLLDEANIPELMSSPKRAPITILGSFAGLLIGVFLALLRERMLVTRGPAAPLRTQAIQ